MNKISEPDQAVMDAINRGNAVVFVDVEMGEPAKSTLLGRIKLELFVKDVSAESIFGPNNMIIHLNLNRMYQLRICFR